jgi:hypothetical protein
MNSIEKYALLKCPVCGIAHSEHPPDGATSTCARYRPNVTAAQAAEVARQDRDAAADVSRAPGPDQDARARRNARMDRVRELDAENARLEAENDQLRAELARLGEDLAAQIGKAIVEQGL